VWWAEGVKMNLNLSLNLRDLTRWLTNMVSLVVGVLLGLRFVLRLFDAAADNEFVNWVYQTSGEILSPFRNVFQGASLDGAVIDFTALAALVVYGVVALWVLRFLKK